MTGDDWARAIWTDVGERWLRGEVPIYRVGREGWRSGEGRGMPCIFKRRFAALGKGGEKSRSIVFSRSCCSR